MSEPRNCLVLIRYTDAEKARIVAAAEKSSAPIAIFIRQTSLAASPEPKTAKPEKLKVRKPLPKDAKRYFTPDGHSIAGYDLLNGYWRTPTGERIDDMGPYMDRAVVQYGTMPFGVTEPLCSDGTKKVWPGIRLPDSAVKIHAQRAAVLAMAGQKMVNGQQVRMTSEEIAAGQANGTVAMTLPEPREDVLARARIARLEKEAREAARAAGTVTPAPDAPRTSDDTGPRIIDGIAEPFLTVSTAAWTRADPDTLRGMESIWNERNERRLAAGLDAEPYDDDAKARAHKAWCTETKMETRR